MGLKVGIGNQINIRMTRKMDKSNALTPSIILEAYPRYEASFYRSSGGAEVDLVLQKGDKK